MVSCKIWKPVCQPVSTSLVQPRVMMYSYFHVQLLPHSWSVQYTESFFWTSILNEQIGISGYITGDRTLVHLKALDEQLHMNCQSVSLQNKSSVQIAELKVQHIQNAKGLVVSSMSHTWMENKFRRKGRMGFAVIVTRLLWVSIIWSPAIFRYIYFFVGLHRNLNWSCLGEGFRLVQGQGKNWFVLDCLFGPVSCMSLFSVLFPWIVRGHLVARFSEVNPNVFLGR